MLIIRPIQDKEQQASFCEACGVPFLEEALAYAAYEETVFLGISQFTVNDSFGTIHHLAPKVGIKDNEALFIMGRQTMNWIDLLGIHTCRCHIDATTPTLLFALGFTDPPKDSYIYTDMTGMFDGACGGHCNLAALLQED
jgi:hypothetical protein